MRPRSQHSHITFSLTSFFRNSFYFTQSFLLMRSKIQEPVCSTETYQDPTQGIEEFPFQAIQRTFTIKKIKFINRLTRLSSLCKAREPRCLTYISHYLRALRRRTKSISLILVSRAGCDSTISSHTLYIMVI